MTLMRRNPFRDLMNMQTALDRFWDDTWRPLYEEGQMERTLALDVHEDDNAYTVITELPGVQAENIQVKLDGDMLVIEGEIPERKVQKEGERALMQERHYGHYSRRIRLPQPVRSDQIEATYENGVLTLKLPKAEEVKAKTIPVKAGRQNP